MSEQNESATDSASLSESARIEITPAQDEPDEIARLYRLERIERAARALMGSANEPEFMRLWFDLRVAVNSPPMPPPDEPRLTRAELIALTEAAECWCSYIDGGGYMERNVTDAPGAIAKARDLIARGEDRLYPERFTIAPDEPALTAEELQTLAASAEHWRYQLERNPLTAPHAERIKAAIARADEIIKHRERKP